MLTNICLTTIAIIIFASFFEWTLHKYFMHRKTWGLEYPVRQHAGVHHNIFRADETYHLIKEEDKSTIPMAWWNGPLLVFISGIPFDLVGWYLGTWAVPITTAVVIASYYGTYEYIHWCMHLPKKRSIERTGIFFRLNGHHVLHHRYMNKNFNVVLPLADLCLGTLLTRSPVKFLQVKGLMVPNLQPVEVTH